MGTPCHKIANPGIEDDQSALLPFLTKLPPFPAGGIVSPSHPSSVLPPEEQEMAEAGLREVRFIYYFYRFVSRLIEKIFLKGVRSQKTNNNAFDFHDIFGTRS